jgi:hypothetical protein
MHFFHILLDHGCDSEPFVSSPHQTRSRRFDCGQSINGLRDFVQWKLMIDLHVREGVSGHARKLGIVGILNNSNATIPFDIKKPCGAVVQHACEQNAYNRGSVRHSCRSKGDVDCRPGVVLFRSS